MEIDEFKRQFGQRVQNHRRRCSMTQEDLAEKIQRSTDTISNIERGVSSTRIETAFRIAEVLGVPVAEFFEIDAGTPLDRERQELLEKLVDLVGREDIDILAAVIAQAEILLRVKNRELRGPTSSVSRLGD